jgi:hypothetical protein
MTRTWTRTGTLALGALVLFTGPTAALAGTASPTPAAVRTVPTGPPPVPRQAGTTAISVVELVLPDRAPARRLPVTA